MSRTDKTDLGIGRIALAGCACALATLLLGAPALRAEEVVLEASDGAMNDDFGQVVALQNGTAAIAAPFRTGAADESGAVYLFARGARAPGVPGAWTEQATAVADDAGLQDRLGIWIDVEADRLVAGAPFYDGLPGNESGAVYSFQRDVPMMSDWGQEERFEEPTLSGGDFFGGALALDGDTLAVGAIGDGTIAPSAGAAYVYRREASAWVLEDKLAPLELQDFAFFGAAVALEGDTLAVGAYLDDGVAIDAGAVYVFERTPPEIAALGGPSWTQIRILTGSMVQPGDNFGFSVALSGDILVVGAPLRDSSPGAGDEIGAIYVFQRDAGGIDNWGEVARRQVDDAVGAARLGWSVAIAGDLAVAGAPFDAAGGVGAGAAYAFRRHVGGIDGWSETARLTAETPLVGEAFGFNVAVFGVDALIGAPGDSTVNGRALLLRPAEPDVVFGDGFENSDPPDVWTVVGAAP
ncbi:MAG: hypothetical protein AAF772_12210 [Acidobacteriota bacterium]